MSYGYDRVRFIRPAFIADTITVSARITAKRDHPKRETQGIVLACEHLYLVERKS
jgi:acyl dehydratase